jgi:hypothetical protein
MKLAGRISPVLSEFLEQAAFPAAWDNLRRQNADVTKLFSAFHSWFDAFRTMRLIHELSDNVYPRSAPEQAVAPLLERAGLVSVDNVAGQLGLLRRLQGVLS